MTTVHARATSRAWWGLGVLLLPALLVSMDISILFVASPSITADLAPTATQWLWMMDSYSFVVAGLLITMGSLGDRIGRRRLLMIGAVAFGLASLALTYAPSATAFIAGRVLLGIGAATLAPSTLALIRSMFADASQRRTAVAAWTVAFSGGAVAGPIVGGFLLEWFHWGSVFLINLPVMALLLIAAPRLVPESRAPKEARFDVTGAVMSMVAVFGLVFAAKRLAEENVDGVAGTGFLISGVFVYLFIQRQRRAAAPLIDVSLFRRPAFSGAVIANVLVSTAMVGLGLLTFTFLQSVHGMSPLHAAIVALPTIAGTMAGAGLASALAQRIRPAPLITGGLLVGALGMSVVASVDADTPLALTIAGYTVLTFGVGAVSTIANSLILSTAPPDRAGAAASISETGIQFGDALGIAAFGTLSSFVYRTRMDDAGLEELPAGPAGDAARDTVGAAVTVADELPPEPANRLLDTALTAFTDSFTTTAVAGAVILTLTAVASAMTLRSVR